MTRKPQTQSLATPTTSSDDARYTSLLARMGTEHEARRQAVCEKSQAEHEKRRDEKQRACVLLATHGLPLPNDKKEWVQLAIETSAPEECAWFVDGYPIVKSYEIIAAAAISKKVALHKQAAAPVTAPVTPTKSEYFLSLIQEAINKAIYTNLDTDHTAYDIVYSAPLGELAPDAAKTIEQYAQSFKWAKDYTTDAIEVVVRAIRHKEQVIFTHNEDDIWDIQLDGKKERGWLGGSFNLSLVAHTTDVGSVGQLGEALQRFKTDEANGDDHRKHTRYIMNRCIAKAEELRNAPTPTASAEAVLEPPIESPPPQTASANNRKPRGLAKRTELILKEYDRRVECGESCNATSLLTWWQKLPRDKKSDVDEHQKSFKDHRQDWESRAIKNINKMIRDYRTGRK